MARAVNNSRYGDEMNEVCMDVIYRADAWARKYRESNSRTRKEMLLAPETPNDDLSQFAFPCDCNERPPFQLFDVLDPLIRYLGQQEPVAWCGTSIRVLNANRSGATASSELRFEYWARPDVLNVTDNRNRHAFLSQRLAEFIALKQDSPPYEMLLTSDLCLNHFRDGTQFQIIRDGDVPSHDSDTWAIDVRPLLEFMEPHQDELNTVFLNAMDKPRDSDELFQRTDNLLRTIATGIPEGVYDQVFQAIRRRKNQPKTRTDRICAEIMRGSRAGLRLLKYLALMTSAWSDWRRITMVPHLSAIDPKIQPGGLVICEDGEPDTWLSYEDLKSIGLVAGMGFSQWQVSLAGTEYEIANRDLTIGLVHHEYQRRMASINDRLDHLSKLSESSETPRTVSEGETTIRRIKNSLKRMHLLIESCYHFASGEPKLVGPHDLEKYLHWDIEEVANMSLVSPDSLKLQVIAAEEVDLRIYVIASEILRNAGKHICKRRELWSEGEKSDIEFTLVAREGKCSITCTSGPHALPIDAPEMCFDRPYANRKLAKGVGFVWILSEQLRSYPVWKAHRKGAAWCSMGKEERQLGSYNVTFEYEGPSRIGV